ncbi:TPA: hypothetical protein DEP96_03765 [Candidatus Uhrbacteria bacterium]|nr:hypothetical protein [Candidatus Uhrbacteria bacterium]
MATYGYLGRTTLDVITALATAGFIVLTVILVANPAGVLAEKSHTRRTDDVRALMQAVLTLQATDPTNFYAFQQAVDGAGSPVRVMLGGGADCSGDWGSQCSDAILADHCVDTAAYLGPYLSHIPFDASSPLFSERQTGYYLTLTQSTVEVGACNPSGLDPIFLSRPLP